MYPAEMVPGSNHVRASRRAGGRASGRGAGGLAAGQVDVGPGGREGDRGSGRAGRLCRKAGGRTGKRVGQGGRWPPLLSQHSHGLPAIPALCFLGHMWFCVKKRVFSKKNPNPWKRNAPSTILRFLRQGSLSQGNITFRKLCAKQAFFIKNACGETETRVTAVDPY